MAGGKIWGKATMRAIAACCLAVALLVMGLTSTHVQAGLLLDTGPRIESRADAALAVLPAEPQIVKSILRQAQPKPDLDDDGPILARADQGSVLAQARWFVADGAPGPQAHLHRQSAWAPRGPPSSDRL